MGRREGVRGNANGSGEERVGEGVRRLTTTMEMKIGLETARVNELAIRRQYGRVDGCNDRHLFACPPHPLHLILGPWPDAHAQQRSHLPPAFCCPSPGHESDLKRPPGRKKKDDVKDACR